MHILLLLPLLAYAARASEPAARDVSLTVSDEKGEVAVRHELRPLEGWSVAPMFKAGVLALSESFPYPYAILKQSPYRVAGVRATYSGLYEMTTMITRGTIELNSRRLLDDPLGQQGSPANWSHQGEFAQERQVASSYIDVGKTFDAGGGWKAAVFAAAAQFSFSDGAPTGNKSEFMASRNVGAAARKDLAEGALTFFADRSSEEAPASAFNNDAGTQRVPSTRTGVEYDFSADGTRYTAGVEVRDRRADSAVRPYAGLTKRRTSALLGVDVRSSKDDFFPDSKTLALNVKTGVTADLELGVTARAKNERYAMAPEAENDARLTVDMTWTPGAAAAARNSIAAARRHKQEYEAARQRDIQAQVVASPAQADVQRLIRAAPTFKEFSAAYRPGDSLGVLAATAELTRLFDRYNYNSSETPNSESLEAIYARARASYISGTPDPSLICLGAAQFAAFAANELGRANGLQIEARAVNLRTADAQGRSSGHAAALVKTPEYGLVFVDWGRLTPTYTWNTEKALRAYQALSGQPALYHRITDASRDGRHVAYLFTEEGKLLVNNLTFHGELERSPSAVMFADEPSADAATVERYKKLLTK